MFGVNVIDKRGVGRLIEGYCHEGGAIIE